ncbi:stage II sporulation protein M [Pleurocapsa sp. FMAR1]|uniref:stage II sporulation protein M n=1 Tax=Pleurocapsa sp. FMAR1 TaxID=3040204 RepID=UPI0029C7FB5E|nr:stage II sporulation protein M [Pleurocapsa sp. FMAR1]
MNVQRWIARREPNWKRLDNLLQLAETKGIKTLSASQIKDLASLYRSLSADLARARTNKVGKILTQDLQKLTSRGYNQVYQGSKRQEWQQVKEFYLWGFPQIVQETWQYIAIATGIFFLTGIIAWWYAWNDPTFITITVPEHLIKKVQEDGELWMGSIVGVEPLASSSIAINNLSVCFAAIAGGITAGLYTLFLMASNGLSIGTITTLVSKNNLAYPFWAFVFPHGSLELPAIFFAGGAGLLIGKAMIFPGKYRRIDALKSNSTKAAQLLFGIIPMLIIAGTIEGFFSPSPLIPSPIKYLTGIGLFLLLALYCCRHKNSEVTDYSATSDNSVVLDAKPNSA